MKILKSAMILAVLFLLPAYALAADLGYMRISLIEGDVQIMTPEAGDWGFASINTPLAEGDQVWVPEGARAELQLNRGTYIRLDQSSALQILSMDKDSSQFYLSQGQAYIYYDAPRGSVIQVDTPDASTRAFNRAIFGIGMTDQYTDVAVYKGYVEAENKVGTTRINAGQIVSLGQDTNGEVAPMGPPDEWEEWNNTRNHKILARRNGGSRYLPAELTAYSADLDNSGRWVEAPEYGMVWTPTVGVDASWTPYRDGRWIWRGADYVWVAYEPWGWAPYHYGRWSFVAGIGWCWVPPVAGAVYWGPGYVGWVRTADYVAWVPLAPGEVYYGRGYYGPHSVNITNININRVNVTNVYRNVNVNNGVTVVNRNTFNTGSPTIVNVNKTVIRQNIFVKNNISVGAPAIKPGKGSYFPSAREIPAAKLPPQPVRNLRVKEIKQSRPLIKERGRSVLHPGDKPKALPVSTVATPRTPGKGRPIRQVQPGEEGKPGGPGGGPAPRGERPQVRPAKKTPAGPEGGRAPRGERPHAKPEEQAPAGAEGGPAPRGERPQVRPAKKMPAGPEGGRAPRGERPQARPEEKTPDNPEGGPAPRGERQQVRPGEKGKTAGPEGGRRAKEKKKHAEPDEDLKKGQKKQGGEEPER